MHNANFGNAVLTILYDLEYDSIQSRLRIDRGKIFKPASVRMPFITIAIFKTRRPWAYTVIMFWLKKVHFKKNVSTMITHGS